MKQRQEGKRLEKRRDDAGLRLDDAAYLARQQLPGLKCSRETIRRYEKIEPESKWNPEIMLALSGVYGVPVEELSPLAAAHFAAVVQLAGRKAEATGQYARFSPIRQALPQMVAA